MRYQDPIVISSFGCVTPLGSEENTICEALRNGVSGIKKIQKFSTEHFIAKEAGIPDEGNEKIFWPSKNRALIGESFYAKLAVDNLKNHPSFPSNNYQENELGCIIGIDEPAIDIQVCFNLFGEKAKKISNDKYLLLEHLVKNLRLSDCINIDPAIILNKIYSVIPFSGNTKAHIGLCSASLQAIGMGMKAIQNNKIKAAIVGGISSKVTPVNLARLELMQAISLDQNFSGIQRSRPFDRRRSGFVLAEGAVLFLIEKLSAVKKRGRFPLLQLLGYGSSLAAENIIAPHTQSLEMKLSMERALEDASILPAQVNHINAHGTSTKLNDYHEALAINQVFGSHANQINVTANKSLHGHLIAAAGAMEILNIMISNNAGFIPGTINLDEQDSNCNLVILKQTQNKCAKIVLKNSFGMGGLAASLVLGTIS